MTMRLMKCGGLLARSAPASCLPPSIGTTTGTEPVEPREFIFVAKCPPVQAASTNSVRQPGNRPNPQEDEPCRIRDPTTTNECRKLSFTINRGIGWHVSYRDEDGIPRRRGSRPRRNSRRDKRPAGQPLFVTRHGVPLVQPKSKR